MENAVAVYLTLNLTFKFIQQIMFRNYHGASMLNFKGIQGDKMNKLSVYFLVDIKKSRYRKNPTYPSGFFGRRSLLRPHFRFLQLVARGFNRA